MNKTHGIIEPKRAWMTRGVKGKRTKDGKFVECMIFAFISGGSKNTYLILSKK